jgi:phosphoribosylformylglycinamidine cyclo-ligase
LPALKPVLDRVHAMAHITGGGLPENVNRALPKTLDAVIDTSSWDVPGVFRILQEAGSVESAEMYRTFNMGVGMVVICAPADVNAVMSAASAAGVAGWKLGSLKPGSGVVILS